MTEQDQPQSPPQLPESVTYDAATVATRLGLSRAIINKWAKGVTMPAYQVSARVTRAPVCRKPSLS